MDSRLKSPDDALVFFAATSDVPLTIVDNWFFQEYVRLARLEKDYKPPSSGKFRARVENFSEHFYGQLGLLFSRCPSLTATIHRTRKFLHTDWTVTITGIDERTWKFVSATIAFDEPFATTDLTLRGNAPAHMILTALDHMKVPRNKLHYISGDASASIFVARSGELEKLRLQSVVSTYSRIQKTFKQALRDCAKDGHTSLLSWLGSAKRLVKFVKETQKVWSAISLHGVTFSEPVHLFLVEENAKDRTTLCNFIEAIVSCPKSIEAIFEEFDAGPAVEHLAGNVGPNSIFASLLPVMSIFRRLTATLTSSTSPTIQHVLSSVHAERLNLLELQKEGKLHETAMNLITHLLRQLEVQFRLTSTKEAPKEFLIAFLLCPTSANFWLRLPSLVAIGVELLKSFPLDQLEPTSTKSTGDRAAQSGKSLPSLPVPQQPPETLALQQNSLKEEIDRYLVQASNCKEDMAQERTLKWWKRNQTSYPLLSRIALRILAIPACLPLSEGMLSNRGAIDLTSRAGLGEEEVDARIFLRAFGVEHYGPPTRPPIQTAAEYRTFSEARRGPRSTGRRQETARRRRRALEAFGEEQMKAYDGSQDDKSEESDNDEASCASSSWDLQYDSRDLSSSDESEEALPDGPACKKMKVVEID